MARVSEKKRPILEAVLELMQEGQAINDIKVLDISKRAGIGKGTVYEYFENKTAVIGEAIIYDIISKVSDFEAHFKQYQTFREQVYAIFDWIDQNTGFNHTLMQMARMVYQLDGNDQVMEYVNRHCEIKEKLVSMLLGDLLGTAVEENLIKKDIQEELLLLSLGSSLIIYILYSHDEHMSERIKTLEKAMVREYTYQSLLKLMG